MDDLLKAVCILADKNNVRVTVKESAKGGVICGASVLTGGLLFGPVGLAMGGIIGGLAGYISAKGKFKPLSTAIKNDLSEKERIKLTKHLKNALKKFVFEGPLVELLLTNLKLQKAALLLVKDFFMKYLGKMVVIKHNTSD